MQEIIQNKLIEIEKEYEVKILYAVESGSRAWGFESTDSDYDVRFVYIHKKDWYLSIDNGRDVIELPIDDLLDFSGWDIRKALKLFRKSNPSLLEWMTSPIVYMDDEIFNKELQKNLGDFFSPKSLMYHYLNMANTNYRGYLKGDKVKTKKYFYVLRPLLACMWICKYRTQPPIVFDDLLNEFELDANLKVEIDKLLERKRAGKEYDLEDRIDILNDFIEEKISYYQEEVKQLGDPNRCDFEVLNKLFREMLEMYK